jgi:hypothetical protein
MRSGRDDNPSREVEDGTGGRSEGAGVLRKNREVGGRRRRWYVSNQSRERRAREARRQRVKISGKFTEFEWVGERTLLEAERRRRGYPGQSRVLRYF